MRQIPIRKQASQPRPGVRARFVIAAGAVFIALALGGRALLLGPGKPSGGDASPRQLSRIEREASARFAGSRPYVTLPDGQRVPPSNEAHALRMMVNAYEALLAKQAEQSDAAFGRKAEAELERRRPLRVVIEWADLSGNREMNFTLEDSAGCRLEGKTKLDLKAQEITRHPCLAQGGDFWEEGTDLKIHLTPISRSDSLWAELLHATKKAMATEAHLAEADGRHGP